MLRFLLLGAVLLSVAACSMTGETITLRERTLVIPAQDDAFTYVVLSAHLNGDPETLPDSLTVPPDSASQSIRWTFGIRGTEIVLNSGASGPGAAVAAFVDTPFDQIDTVAVSGLTFRRDGESACEEGAARAICATPGSSFSPFVPDGNGGVTTDPARVLVLRTGNGQGYAKVRFTDYVAADPGDPAAGGTVTIEYLLNPRGRLLTRGTEVSL